MQPPPPPLNLAQLRILTSEADLIAVGKVDRVKETEGANGEAKKTVGAILSVEKLLKGRVAGKTIIRQYCSAWLLLSFCADDT